MKIQQYNMQFKAKMEYKTCKCECKNYHKCEKDYSWDPRTSICENSKYLKRVADTSVTECDEIVIFRDTIATKILLSGIAIIAIKNVDYCCIIHNISKSEAINLLKNYVLEDCGYIYIKKILF